jgi:hypothetical protein
MDMKLAKLLTAIPALAGAGSAMAIPLGHPLGNPLGHVLGLPLGGRLGSLLGLTLGDTLPASGILVVAAASLALGIYIVRRKRHR